MGQVRERPVTVIPGVRWHPPSLTLKGFPVESLEEEQSSLQAGRVLAGREAKVVRGQAWLCGSGKVFGIIPVRFRGSPRGRALVRIEHFV